MKSIISMSVFVHQLIKVRRGRGDKGICLHVTGATGVLCAHQSRIVSLQKSVIQNGKIKKDRKYIFRYHCS
jgi:hypothetical protein